MVNEMKSILPTHCIPTSVELFFFGGESFELVATGVVHIFLLLKKKKKKREREREKVDVVVGLGMTILLLR